MKLIHNLLRLGEVGTVLCFSLTIYLPAVMGLLLFSVLSVLVLILKDSLVVFLAANSAIAVLNYNFGSILRVVIEPSTE